MKSVLHLHQRDLVFAGKNIPQGKDSIFKAFGFPPKFISFRVSLCSNHSIATFFLISLIFWRIWTKVKRHQCGHADCDNEEEET